VVLHEIPHSPENRADLSKLRHRESVTLLRQLCEEAVRRKEKVRRQRGSPRRTKVLTGYYKKAGTMYKDRSAEFGLALVPVVFKTFFENDRSHVWLSSDYHHWFRQQWYCCGPGGSRYMCHGCQGQIQGHARNYYPVGRESPRCYRGQGVRGQGYSRRGYRSTKYPRYPHSIDSFS
jgi:hypothetical protein